MDCFPDVVFRIIINQSDPTNQNIFRAGRNSDSVHPSVFYKIFRKELLILYLAA